MSSKRRIKIKTDWSRLKNNYKTNPVGSGGDYRSGRIANTRQLTKIIVYLHDIGIPVNITKIRKDTGVVSAIQDAMHWLCCRRIVLKVGGADCFLYIINPECLRDG